MGYIQCTKCGCTMSDKSEGCPSCGNPVGSEPVAAAPQQTKSANAACPECGYPVTGNPGNCPECGFPLHKPAAPAAAQGPVAPPVPPMAPPPAPGAPAPAPQQPEERKSKAGLVWLLIIAGVLTMAGVVVGGLFATGVLPRDRYEDDYEYYDDYDYEEPEEATVTSAEVMYTYADNTWLRSSKEKGVTYNQLALLTYGMPVTVLDSGYEWTNVRVEESGQVGFVATDFLMGKGDFYRLNSLFPNASKRQSLDMAKYRRALVDYAEREDAIGNNDSRAISHFGSEHNRIQCDGLELVKNLGNETVAIFKVSSPGTGTSKLVLYSFDSDDDYTYVGYSAMSHATDVVKSGSEYTVY